MHMQVFEGRRTVVQYAQNNFKQGRVTAPPSKTLFIGNLAWEMTDKDLHELFRDVRNVIDVRVAIDRKTGQPRGFAHAEFIDVASAQDALEVLSSKAPYGRRLRLNYSFGSKRNSQREEMDQHGEHEPQEGEQDPQQNQ
jgi:nucleolin